MFAARMLFSQDARSETASCLPVNQTTARNSFCLKTADEQKTPVDERGSRVLALLGTVRLQSARAQLFK